MQQIFLTIAALIVICPSVSAQGVANGPRGTKLQGFGDVDGQKTLDFWADEERKNTTHMLHLQIELIQEVCSLSDAEAAKLRLAARGVIARHITSGRNQLLKFMIDSELIDEPLEAPDFRAVYDNKLRTFGASSLGEGIVYLRTEFAKPTTEERLWIKVLASTLSDEQNNLINAYYLRRNQAFLETAVTLSISDLDQQIYLNPDQQNRLQSHFVELLEERVTASMPSTLIQAQNMVRPAFKDLPQFKDLLRESQLERLTALEDRPRASVIWGNPSR